MTKSLNLDDHIGSVRETNRKTGPFQSVSGPNEFLDNLMEKYGAANVAINKISIQTTGGAKISIDGKTSDNTYKMYDYRYTPFEEYEKLSSLITGVRIFTELSQAFDIELIIALEATNTWKETPEKYKRWFDKNSLRIEIKKSIDYPEVEISPVYPIIGSVHTSPIGPGPSESLAIDNISLRWEDECKSIGVKV